MTIVVGLTGGIGSGKSSVTNYLQQQGIPVIDTDLIARQVVEPGSKGLNAVVRHFGPDYISSDKTLNRRLLRERVFNDNEAKKALEAILHPLIHAETIKAIEQQLKTLPSYIVVAIPLLIESVIKGNQPSYIDEIWVVDCAEALQVARASRRDNNTAEQIEKIIKLQASRNERLKYADHVIDNNHTLAELFTQMDALISR